MRRFALTVSVVVAACGEDPAASRPAPPPQLPGFALAATGQLAPRDVLALTATLPPGASTRDVRFVVGVGGPGPGPCVGASCLDVVGPVVVLGDVTPVGGEATLSLRLPASVPPGVYGAQALQRAPTGWVLSNPVQVVVATCGDGWLTAGEACVVDTLVTELRADPAAALQSIADGPGWPAPVEGGLLFATDSPGAWELAGDHSGWAPEPMRREAGFSWAVRPAGPDGGYKFTDGATWRADPWSRAYTYDRFGEMSLVAPTGAHLERLFAVTDGVVLPRTVRAWIPEDPPTHVLYVHDGQNLFDPGAIWGGWRLQDAAPPGVMIVGIDNTPARMHEYTHVVDRIGGALVGGGAPAYAAFVEHTVRPLVASVWGEPPTVGVMGSSLGGLVSLVQADLYPDAYAFAASLSGTMGWGSIGLRNPTLIELYPAPGLRSTVVYLDSGGGGTCVDADGDGVRDDGNDADNYCENAQLRDALYGVGYVPDVHLVHWWEPGAPHNEAAWASRVWRPLQIFASL